MLPIMSPPTSMRILGPPEFELRHFIEKETDGQNALAVRNGRRRVRWGLRLRILPLHSLHDADGD